VSVTIRHESKWSTAYKARFGGAGPGDRRVRFFVSPDGERKFTLSNSVFEDTIQMVVAENIVRITVPHEMWEATP
jgi:hypothetical protein